MDFSWIGIKTKDFQYLEEMENMLSGLERMVEYDLIVVLKYLTKKDKMSLRASSTTLRRRIDEFKIWKICGDVYSNDLRSLADDISIIQGNLIRRQHSLNFPIPFLFKFAF